ncbi:MAG: 2-C-methyl-D-erythritol 4-phosphate cytidylyltransferase [Selenomonadaceae bacterium]|nr:2-C-methyl-D-erythritol 4-phosphate cytidylyltransferase [Selenomonadaceae bacterium]MBR4384476.1 2-C-methyl-D-erythritol 4-phosphate cytidylyltransferase [Selenomonadaceae bacterium]
MANIALLTAGGSGTRMHQDIPKQFLTINDRPVIVYTLENFQKHPEIDVIAVTCLKGWEQVLKAYAEQFNITKLKHVVQGGATGQESIRNGLFALEKVYKEDDIVLIHDGNRPMVSADIISDCIVTVKQYGCAISAIPCTEAVMKTEDGRISIDSYPRETLRRTHTPHGFFLKKICDLHRRALEAGITNSVASCTMMFELGEQVYFSAGSEKNIKLTTVEDIEIFKALLTAKKTEWLK